MMYSLLIGGAFALIIIGLPLSAHIARSLSRRKITPEEEKLIDSLAERKRDARYFWR